jgi:hypothetical protein
VNNFLRKNFPDGVSKSARRCLNCLSDFHEFSVEYTPDVLDFGRRLLEQDALPLIDRTKTNKGSGFFKEVFCHKKCPRGSYKDGDECLNCQI